MYKSTKRWPWFTTITVKGTLIQLEHMMDMTPRGAMMMTMGPCTDDGRFTDAW
jgi:hypothetical protein